MSRASLSSRNLVTRSQIAWRCPLSSPSASTSAPSMFSSMVPDGAISATRSSNRSPCAKISVIAISLCPVSHCLNRLPERLRARREAAVVARLLHHLPMQREIEAFALGVLRHAQAHEHLDHEQDDQADDGVVDEDGRNADALVDELGGITL